MEAPGLGPWAIKGPHSAGIYGAHRVYCILSGQWGARNHVILGPGAQYDVIYFKMEGPIKSQSIRTWYIP